MKKRLAAFFLFIHKPRSNGATGRIERRAVAFPAIPSTAPGVSGEAGITLYYR